VIARTSVVGVKPHMHRGVGVCLMGHDELTEGSSAPLATRARRAAGAGLVEWTNSTTSSGRCVKSPLRERGTVTFKPPACQTLRGVQARALPPRQQRARDRPRCRTGRAGKYSGGGLTPASHSSAADSEGKPPALSIRASSGCTDRTHRGRGCSRGRPYRGSYFCSPRKAGALSNRLTWLSKSVRCGSGAGDPSADGRRVRVVRGAQFGESRRSGSRGRLSSRNRKKAGTWAE
jgi:hypothetical protein